MTTKIECLDETLSLVTGCANSMPYCPKCHRQMVFRKPRVGQTWDAFWACSAYPAFCDGKRQVGDDWLAEGADRKNETCISGPPTCA